MIDRSQGDAWAPDLRHQEHIDILGHLNVPVAARLDRAPARDGWVPFWVNVNMEDSIQKVVKYRKAAA